MATADEPFRYHDPTYQIRFSKVIQMIVIAGAPAVLFAMRASNRIPWNRLEEHSSTAFIVVGGLWFIDTVLLAFERFLGISILGTTGPVNGVLIVFAVLVSIIGLLGFYPRLVDRVPRLAFASVAVSVLTAIGFGVILVWAVSASLVPAVPSLPDIIFMLFVVALLLTFLLFDVAILWAAIPSRLIGSLLFAAVLTLAGDIVGFAIYQGNAPEWEAPVVGAILTAVTLAIGYRLRIDSVSSDPAKSSVESVG